MVRCEDKRINWSLLSPPVQEVDEGKTTNSLIFFLEFGTKEAPVS